MSDKIKTQVIESSGRRVMIQKTLQGVAIKIEQTDDAGRPEIKLHLTAVTALLLHHAIAEFIEAYHPEMKGEIKRINKTKPCQ